MSQRASIFLSTLALAVVAAPASAHAAERWAAPDGTGSSAFCLKADPCSLADAAAGAIASDEVVLTTGSSDYVVATTLQVPASVTLRAADADDRPRLVADPALSGPAVRAAGAGATVAGLEIDATAAASSIALDMTGSTTGAQLVLRSAATAARITGSGVTLRDTLARSTSSSAAAGAIALRDGTVPAPVRLVNVTAVAENGSARAIRCGAGTTEIVNAIIRGAGQDVMDVSSTTCTVKSSAYRTANSSATIVDGGGNIAADPIYEATGDSVPAKGSPTIDAGETDGSEAARRDVNGQARVQHGKIDMGAYETYIAPVVPDDGTPTGDPATPVTPAPAPAATATAPAQPAATATGTTAAQDQVVLPAATTPDLGKTVTLQAAAGAVRVKLPGTDRYVDLADASTLPVGTIVDTNDGSVTLTSELADGTTQSGTFGGGKFSVAQPADGKGMTDIVLRGGWFQSCIPAEERAARAAQRAAAKEGKVTARAATAAGRKRKSVRSLWSKDKRGKFRTHGATSITTVRGTSWVTEDTCDGTVVRVSEGAVDVKAKRSGKVTRVEAGESVLVKRLPRPKLK